MSDAEIMVILILFHSGGFYYKEYICNTCPICFPDVYPTPFRRTGKPAIDVRFCMDEQLMMF